MPTTTLYLYSTAACHLCDTARELMAPHLDALGLALVEVDIADNDALMEQYGIRIPVIRFEGGDEDLGWPFSEEQFLAFVEAADGR